MHANETAKTPEDRKRASGTARTMEPRGRIPGGLSVLQSTVGNAAVIQRLRQGGHPWAQEEHQHDAGCGHQQGERPAVQRSAVHSVLRTPGRPLDDAIRTDMEARLGADFSAVRMHTDSAARASAAEVGARAYTSGNHVVIGDGGADKHTLAHELTHVIQQSKGTVAGTDNGAGLKVSDPSDRYEREAETTARRVMSGPSPLQRPAARPDGTARRPDMATAAVQRVHYEQGEEVTAHPGFSVTLQATLNGTAIGTFSSETTAYSPMDHAEDQLLDELDATIDGLYGKAQVAAALAIGGQAHTLSIHLSASPCSSTHATTTKTDAVGCAERLSELARNGYAGHTFAITVIADHLYGRSNASRESSARAISDMRAAGITVQCPGA
ncbi:eCIS core domain-containing protein [Streptomyces sp. OR43]|uniref:eCIS core domain-containing protein n=1 Tax=Streptomyces sp. or43 TaxID=2478957 RepID=UPI0011CE6E3B|nr:DUF4157 domain-containing protein [Streptomyces sp. or43]